MSAIEVRPFRRPDRDQLAALVNAHAAAVVPGAGVSVATVLSHLERQPGETIVDPWVAERVTLVAEQHHTVVAAAHLLRYFADERAGTSYRGSGDIHWLLFWPVAPGRQPLLERRHRGRGGPDRRVRPPARGMGGDAAGRER